MAIGKSAAAQPGHRPWVLMFVAVCLVAANMRTTIMGVGPLLEEIADSQGVPLASLGALASVPLIAWAVVSPLAHGLSTRLGLTRAVTWSLLVLLVGTAWRSAPGTPINLWLGTALIGASLAVGNVLLPAVIKREFADRVPLVMGVYSALLGGVASVAAGIAVPISQAAGGGAVGWRVSLLAAGATIPIAIAVWVVATGRGRRADPDPASEPAPGAPPAVDAAPRASDSDAGRRIWRDRTAWFVACYFGTQAAVFFCFAAWIAPIGTSLGRSPVEAGFDVMLFQMLGVCGSLLAPLLLRSRLRRWWPVILPLFEGAAAVGIVTAPDLMPLWAAVGGPACAASLSVSLTLMAVRARTSAAASALSGMSQSVGYLIAGIGPAAFGWLHDFSGEWLVPIGLVLLLAAGQFLSGLAVGRERYVFEEARP